MSSLRYQMRYMNPYDLHKLLINEYVLKKPGDTKLLRRDTSKDKTDYDVIKQHHRFLWDKDEVDTWEDQFAKKYYDKLFKEYCLGDFSFYKENKIGLRWRIEQEVIIGKGQFICGNKKCNIKEDLKTWEVNFAYKEQGERKNALVKIRLCPDCSNKLNYHSKKREVKRLKKKSKDKFKKTIRQENEDELDLETNEEKQQDQSSECSTSKTDENEIEESPWDNQRPDTEPKTRDEEMDEYLDDLLL